MTKPDKIAEQPAIAAAPKGAETREAIRAAREARIAGYKHYPINEFAKRLFADEQGLQYALQFLAQMAGRANNDAWAQVYEQYPELKNQFAVFDEKAGDIYIVPEEDLNSSKAEALEAATDAGGATVN